MKILLIEDSKHIAELIFDFFEDKDYQLDYAMTGRQGLWLANDNQYDCIILDLMLPQIDGLTVCRELRANHNATPVIMLTARDTDQDMLMGFKCGADDYIVKPFDLELLEARLTAVVRRASPDAFKQTLTCGPLEIDLRSRRVFRDNASLSLNPSCFAILKLLMQKYPAPASRDDITRVVWGEEPPEDDVLRKHMYQLRKIVDKPFTQSIIKTLPKIGYAIELIHD